jgi:tetratricopeptide (TPR) repeat protein
MRTETSLPLSTQLPKPEYLRNPLVRNLWQVPLFLTGLLALVAVWLVRPLWYDSDFRQLKHDLSRARSMLEGTGSITKDPTPLLHDILNRVARFPRSAGEAHFLVGSVYVRVAGGALEEQAEALWREARSHLEQAESHGVADSDHIQLLYRLGKALFQTWGEPQRIIDCLLQCADQIDERGDAYNMLSRTYLRLPTPDVRAALAANEKQLQLPTEDERALAPARLLRGELLLLWPDPGSREAARKVLARISPAAPASILSRARYLRARSYQEEGAWAEAATLWEQVLADVHEPPSDVGRVSYWLALCYHNLNRPAEAIPVWQRTINHGGEEGQAALLYLADTRIKRGELAAALDLYRGAFRAISKSTDYQSSLIKPAEAASLVEFACRVLREAGQFDNARELAGIYGKLASLGRAQALLGAVAEASAKAKHEKAQQLKDREAAREEEKAQLDFHEAGAAFEVAGEAATVEASRADSFWRAADDYLQGHDFVRAVSVLERFVKLKPAPERLSEAWFRLGQAHQALHNAAAAGTCYLRCIEYPGPFAYHARCELATLKIEQGKPEEAEEILQQNLDLLGSKDSDRKAHERTLFALAELLFRRGKYRMAAQRWETALTLYPTNPGVASARFQLGECYRRLADIEFQSLRPGEPLDTQPHYRRQYVLWLETAAANYQKLFDDLEARRSVGLLTAVEAKMLQHALFELAECRFDRGQYDEAVRLYENIASRYQNQVEGLIALRQVYRCHLIMTDKTQLEKAFATLQRARIFLDGLGDGAFEASPQTETRQAWELWIRQAEQQLKKLGLPISQEAK